MEYYDLTYLIQPDIEAEKALDFHQKIVALLQEQGAVLDKIGNPVKINLAYPILKKQSAYLAFVVFFFKKEKIEEIKDLLQKDKSILRFLICKAKKAEKIKRSRKLAKEIQPKEKEPIKTEKVKLEEMEKKLEELLENQ